ncbi:hypothetical protein VNI00_006551 [Paramarasmius palmivorus]|uniref:Major facilitator superfamily (MFS) profile domain-containing protein n=1 Tax=Paramarasmius palmivorus TaxID=297713 RepID=A0AAW0D6Z7_9AGAR
MPSEPLEAEFARPPALSSEQEEELRVLGQEHGALQLSHAHELSRRSTEHTLANLERSYTRQGIHVVEFEKGKREDPREWSRWRKWYVTLTTAFLCTAAALGSSIITGDMEGPTRDLHTSQEIVNLTVTCFVIGFGIGALAKNAATLVVGRQIAGLAASAPICNVGGSVADVWAIEERGLPMATFSFAIFLGPVLGPLIGGWIGERAGWRWIYWVLFIFSGLCFMLTLVMPETLATALLRKKAKKLREETGDDKYRTIEELESPPFKEMMKTALGRPLVMLFTEPILAFMTIYLSFVYSILYLLFFAFPIAFEEVRGFGLGMTGVTFVSVMIGITLAMLVMPLQEKIYAHYTKFGTYPEARLFPMMLGAILLPSALFVFAFTGAYGHVHWIGPCIAGFMFGFALILLYISGNSYIVDCYSDYAASAIAAKTLVRSEIGAMVPLYVTQMFHNMGFQYAGLLLALVGVGIAPIPFVFYRYGEGVRGRSGRATQMVRRTEKESNLESI